MKYNLKNRPKPKIYRGSRKISKGSFYKHRQYGLTEVDQWFEGFEAELREKLQKLEDMVYAAEIGDLEGWASDLVAQARKEILGE